MFTHRWCLGHDPGRHHPEAPARLRQVQDHLSSTGWELEEAPPADLSTLTSVHPAPYLEMLAQTSGRGRTTFDADTYASPGSWKALLGGAGAAVAAADVAAVGGRALSAIRPPGHHALARRPMGFCFIANAVVVARRIQSAGKRHVLIVDWDVHHGNGTQALVQEDATIRYVSMHQWPAYPGTGRARERGVGNIFNVPLAPGLGREVYRSRLWQAIGDATRDFVPDALVISAGFDCLQGDPLGGFTLEPEDLADITGRLCNRWPGVGIASVLEGGYNPSRLAVGVAAHLHALKSA